MTKSMGLVEITTAGKYLTSAPDLRPCSTAVVQARPEEHQDSVALGALRHAPDLPRMAPSSGGTAIPRIHQLREAMRGADLRAQTASLKARLQAGESLDDVLPEAFATAWEAARRATGLEAHDQQLTGAIALHQGKIAEMATGEGKTLTAIFPLYLHALEGKGAHLVTVNEFLARTQGEEMAAVFEALGLTCRVVEHAMSRDEKRRGYAADVTYVCSSTLGFDYLQDNLAKDPAHLVQRDPHYAIVDEADEVFLDDARTPLILAETSPAAEGRLRDMACAVAQLRPGTDFEADRDAHRATLTDSGRAHVQRVLGVDLEDPVDDARVQAALRQARAEGRPLAVQCAWQEEAEAIRARLPDGDVQLVYPGGPQPAPSAVVVKSEDLGNGDDLFRLDRMLEARALYQKDWDYIVSDGRVEIVDPNTGRVLDGRRYANGVHQALEALEGVPIQPEQHTAASITLPNLFRRYPTLAGMSGTAKTEASELRGTYGLDVETVPRHLPCRRVDLATAVFPTAREKYEAIAERVARACEDGQPVLVGTRSVAVNQYLSRLLQQRGIPHQVLNAHSVKENARSENEIVALAGRSGMVTVATNMAGRGVDIKPDRINFKRLTRDALERKPAAIAFERDGDRAMMARWLQANGVDIPLVVGPASGADVLDSRRYESPGLLVIGAEPNESRRVDDQLRGRSGRHGAPGESQRYASLEDEVLRGRPALARLLERHGRSHEKLDAAIADAQRAVEARHREGREAQSSEYDGLLNAQRDRVYAERRAVLMGRDLREDVARWADDRDRAAMRQRESLLGAAAWRGMCRDAMLEAIDVEWRAHLEAMEGLRAMVPIREAVEDPGYAYVREGTRAYEDMLERVRQRVVRHVLTAPAG